MFMKIINFYFGNNCNIIFIFFAVLLIIYSIKYFYESCSFCLWEKLHDLPFQEQLKFDFFCNISYNFMLLVFNIIHVKKFEKHIVC